MAAVAWVQCSGGVWCPLERVNLSNVTGSGVYVIWAGNRWVYVGKGDIASRVQARKSDPAVLAFGSSGQLMVTWALVPASQMDGIERYLADTLAPAVGTHHPSALPIPVNLPGQ